MTTPGLNLTSITNKLLNIENSNIEKATIKKAVVSDELQFGDFVWTSRSNGNIGLLWKGGGN